MTAVVIRGDARRLPLASNSVDLVVTSPPFLNLRSYTDGGAHYDGQVGVGSRDQFLNDLWDVTAEMARVLKPTGSIWVELGDSYTNKSLNMSPHRYAIGCVDKLGLILRAEVIWDRPNGLPESVTDRVRRSHSVWFHLVKQPRYYSAVDHIRTLASGYQRATGAARATPAGQRPRAMADTCNPLGALPGSVWEIPTEPLQVPAHLGIDHYAAFPLAWPRRIILGWSPAGICTTCGEGRRPVTDVGEYRMAGHGGNYAATPYDPNGYAHGVKHGHGRSSLRMAADRSITGEACACPDTTAPTRPAVVVDPFGGTGTTALVAHALGRLGISGDMSADYCRLASWRTTDPDQLAKAMGVAKPPKQMEDQITLDLFGGDAA